MAGYDIIGDVHGCADKLEGLLRKLEYEKRNGVYLHTERQAIFVGDLIDRGDKQVETLELVRAMVQATSAQIVMGNHEFNAISYATVNPEIPGEFMRPHNEKNRLQHKVFIEQVPMGSNLHSETIEWFRTLPLYLDLGDLRIVHACWSDEAIELVNGWFAPGDPMPEDFVVRANQKGTTEHHAIEVLLKGPELSLEKYGQEAFKDKDEHPRREARIRWWDKSAETLADLTEIPPGAKTEDGRPYAPLPNEPCGDGRQYDYQSERPVFYGHYWRKWVPVRGQDWTSNTACVDFSAVLGGPLVAYRWSGEPEIHRENYVPWPES
jgi:hypothetical protein